MPVVPAFAATTTVGFIYVGPRDDFGYNQAHAEGAAALKKMAGVKVVEEERVPETVQVAKTMESMINLDGASLLFPTSFGYFNPYILDEAAKFPKVRFEHAGGLWTPKNPKNVGSYFGYIFEGQYINGIIAGYASKSGKLGFVAAKPIPQVLQNLNAFTLGAQSVNPKATTQVIFTGDWSLPVKEAEATNSMIDQGIDVVTMHVDSPKVVVQTAAKRGAMVCGYHTSQAKLAPEAYLTGAEWNWTDLYPKFVSMWMKGEEIPNFYRGAFKEGLIKQSPYGSKVSAEAKNHADDVKAKLAAGSYVIFKGPIKDNAGNVVVPAGSELIQTNTTDEKLESMHFLVEGVKGSLPA
jgi:simple sugar transport system substrate-binding protein